MTTFLAFAALLALLALALLAWPLLRPRPDAEGKPVPPAGVAAAVVAGGVPLLAFVLYFTWSEWDWGGSAQGHAANPSGSMAQMATQLEARLMREQGDIEGWKLLGRTYVMAQNYPKAVEAYRQAYTLTAGEDLDALLGYAEARVLADENDFEGEAGRLFESAVQAEASDPRALWYSGVAAMRRDDLATARTRWSKLKELGAPPEIVQIIDTQIAEIDRRIGTAPAGATSPVAAEPAAPAAEPAALAAAPLTVPAEGIALRVAVAPSLAERVPAGATVYVFASDASGGPPLAAVRRTAASLPMDVTLSDADAMVAGTSLTQVEKLNLIARVSLTGRPVASAGDLFGEVRYDPRARGRITLTIDRVVP